MKKSIFGIFKGDKTIWVIVVILSVFSLLAIYSSTNTLAYKYQGGNTNYYLFKHFILVVFGIGLMLITHKINYKYFSRISQIAIYIAIPLLLLTLITGSNINQATRWLTLPIINVSFQTSDFAKLALIMFIARMLAKRQDNIKDLKNTFVPIIVPILATVLLIFPANFSTAAILFLTSLVLLFIGRINMKYILALIGLGMIIVTFMLFLAKLNPELLPRLETWTNRIENYINDGEASDNYQVEQAKIAIARGSVFGVLPGNSLQRNLLPHPYSDFVYAIIIEEYGLIGGSIILFLYMILLYRSVKIASKSPGSFGAFLVIGLSFSLVFQALINMGVAVNLLPVTGQPLPLVSMGGSSLIHTSFAIGIILSVSRKVEESENQDIEKEAEVN